MGRLLAKQVEADHISVDPGHLGCLANHLTVWRWHAQHPADFSVVLEDDAVPVPDFRDQLQAALTAAPTDVVSLYLGSGYISDATTRATIATAQENDTHWLLTRGRVAHAVALAVRGEHINSLVNHVQRKNRPIDAALSQWARARGHHIAYSVPSLVDHSDERSLVGKYRRAPRKAFTVGGHQQWTGRSLFMV